MQSETSDGRRPPTKLWRLLILGLVLPTFVTWIYFELLDGSAPALQQTAYAAGKAVQFLLPLLAWRLATGRLELARRGIQPVPQYRLSGILGIVSGLVIGATILAVYFFVLAPNGWMDGPRLAAREKLKSMGLNSQSLLLAVAIFYSLVHSALEEYYWRWFVFARLTAFMSMPWAVCISSLGFMSHHVIVLARYFGWGSPLTIAFALGVAVGGAVWAELYRRNGSLLGPWLSHALVDASIFVIAFDMAFTDAPV